MGEDTSDLWEEEPFWADPQEREETIARLRGGGEMSMTEHLRRNEETRKRVLSNRQFTSPSPEPSVIRPMSIRKVRADFKRRDRDQSIAAGASPEEYDDPSAHEEWIPVSEARTRFGRQPRAPQPPPHPATVHLKNAKRFKSLAAKSRGRR